MFGPYGTLYGLKAILYEICMLLFTELCTDYKEKDIREYEEPRLQQLATPTTKDVEVL